MTPASVRAARQAELRTTRGVTILLAVVAATTMVATPLVVTGPGVVPSAPWLIDVIWWSSLTAVLAGAVAPWVGIEALRWLNGLNTVITLTVLAIAAAVLVQDAVAGEHTKMPWLLSISGITAISALIAWGERAAAATFVTAVVLVQVMLFSSDASPAVFMANDLHSFTSALIGVLVVRALLDASRQFDRTSGEVIGAEATRAAEAARRAVRARTQALVHDEVLTALLLASHNVPSLRLETARQATRARELISALDSPPTDGPRPVDRLVAQLADLARELDPAADVRRPGVVAPSSLLVDPDADAALVGAVRQALHNSLRHAPDATRVVRVDVADDMVTATVSDDGPGFDRAAVASDRMGVQVSILGRMASVAGGTAHVDSRPGGGTTVTVGWQSVDLPTPEPAEIPAAANPSLGAVRLGLTAFVVAQTVLAALTVVAVDRAGDPWVSVAAWAAVTASLLLLGWRDLGRPARWRSWTALALVTFTCGLTAVPLTAHQATYADWWYLFPAGLVLSILAVRGRPGIAVLGVLPLVLLPAAAAHLHGYDPGEVRPAVARPVVTLLISVLGAALIARTRTRTAALRAAELASRSREVWAHAQRAEAHERVRQLEELAGPVLAELAGPAPLSASLVADCVALEGQLRDHYRGGRLARSPLTEAAASARRRGVDVALLDDGDDGSLDEHEVGAVVAWMSDQLDRSSTGRFVGRLLPAGREAVASVVAGEESASYPLGAQGARV